MNREDLLLLFEENKRLTKINNEGMANIDLIYASSEQIFAVSFYQDAATLEATWEDAAEELAVSVQSRLTGKYDALRWDMYLILFVERQSVPVDLKVSIENNRNFFRKIVVETNDSSDWNSLPVAVIQQVVASDDEVALFEQKDFLKQLWNTLPGHIAQYLENDLFEQDELDATHLFEYLDKIKI